MQTQLDALLREYHLLRAQVVTASSDIATMTTSARSADLSVTATVSAQGELVALSLDPLLAVRLDLRMLAARVLEASGHAAADMRELRHGRISDALPVWLRDLTGPDGLVNFDRLLHAWLSPDAPGGFGRLVGGL